MVTPATTEQVGPVTVIRGLRQDGRLPTAAVDHVNEITTAGGVKPTALTPSTDRRDITDDLRAALASLAGKPGVVRVPAGQFYLGGGATGKPLVLETGQRVDGAGANTATVLWVDDATKGLAQIITSTDTTGVGVTGVTFENRCANLGDTSFRDPVSFRGVSGFELSYNTATTTGVGFQTDLTVKAQPNTASVAFPRGGWVHDCRFTALTEFLQCHNLLVERCVWDLDRGLKRPASLRGATQTGFRVTGAWGVVEGNMLRDCTMTVHGTGEKIEPFELVRAQAVRLDRFRYRGDRPDVPALIDMGTTKPDQGVVEGQMGAEFTGCEFGDMTMTVVENVDLTMRGCVWRNKAGGVWNAITDANGSRPAQATTQYPTRLTLDGCRFLGGGRVLMATGPAAGEYRIQNTSIEYDRAVYTAGVSVTGANKRVVMGNNRFVLVNLAGGAPSVVYLTGVQYAHFADLEVVVNPGVAPTAPAVWLAKSGLVSMGTVVQPKAMTTKMYREASFTGTITDSGPLIPA